MRCRFVLVPICLDTELSFSMGAEMSWCRTVLLPAHRPAKKKIFYDGFLFMWYNFKFEGIYLTACLVLPGFTPSAGAQVRGFIV